MSAGAAGYGCDVWPKYGPMAGSYRRWNSGATKKCARSRTIGPPTANPSCVRAYGESRRNAVFRANLSPLAKERGVPRESVAAGIDERGAAHVVGAAPRHRVYERPGEVAVAHVVRREEDLVFPDGLDGNRLPARHAARDVIAL